jgi:hypothetical protein
MMNFNDAKGLLENIHRGPLSTLVGLVLIGVGLYMFIEEISEPIWAAILAVMGIYLALTKDPKLNNKPPCNDE